jgi:uncharacterized protein YdhG (YjbR/CyaY superfamily)
MESHESFETYIERFPPAVAEPLRVLRQAIRNAAPDAVETFSYGIPTYDQKGHVVHFAGYAGHVSLYPGADGIVAFREELSGYRVSKGTVQFPLGAALPVELIGRIVRYRLEQNLRWDEEKKAKRKKKT